MDFFAQQDHARRRTTLLVFYFAVAVVLIVATLNGAVAFGLAQAEGSRIHRHSGYDVESSESLRMFQWRTDAIAWTTVLTLAIIGGGTFYRWLTLRGGGRAVAEMAGGQPVPSNTIDPKLRRLLNVIEEMSIASGVPMPAVYVLEAEPGINAFAAGYTPSDAAVAVTRGCLDKLNRDELQGVIAHEFSHILNGDMRLNIRLIGVLFGILMLAMIGRGLLQSLRFTGGSRRGKGGGGALLVIVALGLALLAIGYIGFFFGRLIQAAVSRQREFLADAAAVQFTRNPDGLGGALKKIGGYALGSGIVTEQATQLRHFFFAQAFTGGLVSWFATHPPLEERIRAVDPQWDGKLPEISSAAVGGWEPDEAVPREEFVPPRTTPPPLSTAVLLASVGTTTPAHLVHARNVLAAIPPALVAAARTPAEALPIVFALLVAGEAPVRTRQLDLIRVRHGMPFAERFNAVLPEFAGLRPELRLPLLNLALPALRALAPAEVTGALDTARALIEADGEVTLFEFMVEKALDRHVAAPVRGGRPGAVNFYSFGALRSEIELLLSALSRVGAGSAAAAATAFAAAVARIPPLAGQLQLQSADTCTLERVSAALDRLVQASPAIRKVVLAAGSDAVAADGVVEPDEADLLRAVADSLDCPIPPLLDAGTGA